MDRVLEQKYVDASDSEVSALSSENPHQFVSDEELRALTAAFTEMTSTARSVAGSLSRINLLAHEIHTDLRATCEALAEMRRFPAQKGTL